MADTQELKAPRLSGWLDGLGGNEQRQTRWLTPKSIVKALGEFDLDPAGAPDWELARKTFVPERGEDGLTLPWEGRVWLNPPYGREAAPFMRRMAEHNHGTMLVFAAVETAIWHEVVWPLATAVLFPKGRFTFVRAGGEAAAANSGKPSALIAFGEVDANRLALVARTSIEGQFIDLTHGRSW